MARHPEAAAKGIHRAMGPAAALEGCGRGAGAIILRGSRLSPLAPQDDEISCLCTVDTRPCIGYLQFRTSPFSDAAWEAFPDPAGGVATRTRAALGINPSALGPRREVHSLDWDRQGRVTPA